MFVKVMDSASYININKMFGLCIFEKKLNAVEKMYYIHALPNESVLNWYCLKAYNTKAEAENALKDMVAAWNGQQAAPTSQQHPEAKDEIIAAARVGKYVAPRKQKPLPPSPSEALAKELRYLIDDFAGSGETDNLLRITAYIRAYLEQEAKNE